jgi:[ribosomal protein S5]-alanine N-acetyltransferase
MTAPPAVTWTQRLRLEPLTPAHVDDIAPMLADPQVGATMGGVRDRAYAEERTLLQAGRWRADGFGMWAAYSRADGGFVGRGGIQRTVLEGTDVVEVGWCLPPSRWHQGFATEIGRAGLDLAFGPLGLAEVVAFTQPHNAASLAVMARLGMAYDRDCVHAELPHVLYRCGRGGG